MFYHPYLLWFFFLQIFLQLIRQLIPNNAILEKLWEEHLAYETKLDEFNKKRYLSAEDEMRRREIQKLKLVGDGGALFMVDQELAARPLLPVMLGSFLVNTYTVRRAIPFFERLAQIRNISVFETLK